jgi:hypothetical protein
MRSPCCLYEGVHVSVCTSQLLKVGIVEPKETASTIPYKHMCDITPESLNSAVREATW